MESAQPVANEEIVAQLVSMGFSQLHCQKAAINTSNAGVEEATNWLFSHMDDPGNWIYFQAWFDQPITWWCIKCYHRYRRTNLPSGIWRWPIKRWYLNLLWFCWRGWSKGTQSLGKVFLLTLLGKLNVVFGGIFFFLSHYWHYLYSGRRYRESNRLDIQQP